MGEKGPLFILAGNGPYENRGCEAIVRGTMEILREYFQDPRCVCLSHFQNEDQFIKQVEHETNDAIIHLASRKLSKKRIQRSFWKLETWHGLFNYYFDRNAFFSWVYRDMLPYLNDTAAVLSVGGDNYSLDYGVPTHFTALDDLVLAHERPLVIWGASVGPFSAMPDYEEYMCDHLRKVTGIFVRESATVEYLESIGVAENVYPVADPAFLMEPIKPAGIEREMPLDEEAIGINLSPLMAKFVTGGDLERWTKVAASIILKVAETTEMPVYLIPHVTSPHSDDSSFMQRVVSLIQRKNENIALLSSKYTASETKWIISQMAVFAGSRTHATIAALSSGVPTMSFGYSIKARGINRDIFGHTRYCLGPMDLEAETVTDRIISMCDDGQKIRMELQYRIPEVQKSALHAGSGLRRIVEENIHAQSIGCHPPL